MDIVSKLKLVSVLHFPEFGGPHTQALRLAPALEQHGVESVTVLPDGPGADRLRAGGLNVRTVPPADSALLAERMMLVANDPVLRSAMSQTAHNLVKGKDYDQFAQDLEASIEQILALPKRIRPLGMQRGRSSR